MPDRHSDRLFLAQRIVAEYSKVTDVTASALVGSVSRGEADEFSDVEIAMYYDVLPRPIRVALAQRRLHGIRLHQNLPYPTIDGWVDAFKCDGVVCEVACFLLSSWEVAMADVLERYDVDPWKQIGLCGILDALPLSGSERITGWQAAARNYPDGLRTAMIRHHLTFPSGNSLRQAAHRQDDLLLYQHLVTGLTHILGVLLGVNRIYHPVEFKRMRALIARFTVCPPNLTERLMLILHGRPDHAVHELEVLIEETQIIAAPYC